MEAASPLQASCSRVIGCSSMGTRELRHKVLQLERLLRYTNITILITIITIAIIVIMTILLLLFCGYYYSWQVQTLQLFRGRRRLLQNHTALDSSNTTPSQAADAWGQLPSATIRFCLSAPHLQEPFHFFKGPYIPAYCWWLQK